jgi:two-component system, probable response regulator PhcQ
MTHTVLFVDDDLGVLQALVRRLRKEPYQIRTATSAEEAQGAFERCPIDLVVSDWRMPGMSGTEFLAKVAKEYPNCIRIMLTGEPSLAVAIGAVNNGEVHRFLTKPYDAEALAGIIREALQERDASLLTRKGGHRPADEGKTVARTEGEPGENRQSRESVLAHVSDCIITVDHTGKVLEFNAAAERTFRCCRGAVLGKSLAEVFPSGGLRHILAGYVASPSSATAVEGNVETRLETTIVLSDGTELPVDLVTIAGNNAGQPIFTSFIRDMSKIRGLEAALKTAETQLRQARELESLGRLANGVAPEVDNLLTAINGFCDMLLADAGVAGVARELVRQIRKASERGTVLTRPLLVSSGKQRVAPGESPAGAARTAGARAARPAAQSPPMMERR